MLGQELLLLSALQEGVGFYLVDCRHDLVVEHQVQVAVGRKVRDADRAGAAFGIDFFQGSLFRRLKLQPLPPGERSPPKA